MNKVKGGESKINVGYILPDFKQQEIACMSYPLLTAFHDREFNVFCYTSHFSTELKEECNPNIIWRNMAGVSAELAVRGIQKDKLDILVDLSSHTASHCLQILAKKPAGIQMSSIGYFYTTGLKTVEYLLTDKYCNPEQDSQEYFMEEPLRISQSHFCYKAGTELPDYKEAPVLRNGYVTFGCFHHFTHVTDEFLGLWQSIIAAVPNAHLLLKSRIFGSGYGCQETRFRLKRLGFDLAKVELRSLQSDDMNDYRDVDMMLDTWPYQGGITTCDALYMGVPVIVLAGKRHSARFGYSILKNIGLEECLAESTDEYIKKAISLANTKYKLLNLHKNLRERMLKSPLMDEKRYIAKVEQLYKKVLQKKKNRLQDENLFREVHVLLSTVEEGFTYIHGHLMRDDGAEIVLQIFADIALALKNMEIAFEKEEDEREVVARLLKKCNKARQLAKSKQRLRAGEIIAVEIMPLVRNLTDQITGYARKESK
ncbi:O-linked N-acetylglucosamine transferase, SPINDLY family protein [Anaerosinus massiliensis]|uniref:O-linked N-acetylglucosamine transferase, SPINDLY family protein n=1 Tax=Massilibacillus massiliensis TaxID=1806837 RepID=UPI000AD7083C|nr:hypothetical protein [Massilibacillus massiliensis]